MAYSETIPFVVGDTRPLLRMTIRDKNTAASGQTLRPNDPTTWAPIDLTGATVRLYIRLTGTTALLDTITCVLITPAAGTITAEIESDTFAVAGTYDGEVEITYSDGGIQTLQDFIKFKVRDQTG